MSKIRVGVFGSSRGRNHYLTAMSMDEFQIVAVCDRRLDKIARAKRDLKDYPTEVKYYTDFEDFIECPMDAVFVINYFHEHAKYAIRCLKKGLHVYSECTAAPTLKECVELCEAVEESGCVYMLGENYPYTAPNMEIKRLYEKGFLGRALYAQGEYNHAECESVLREITPAPYHWRGYLPRTYYSTHSLGPLMYYTGAMPKTVSAHAVHSPELVKMDDFRHNYDALAYMDTTMDDGSLFHFSGCSAIASPSRYRLVGENGSAETGGVLGGQVSVNYLYWNVPENAPKGTYTPKFEENDEEASKAGHGGGDYWTIYNFAKAINEGKQPFFDVYRGCAMSACAILGWRSALNGGMPYDVPDFRSKEQRDKVRDDDHTPFVDDYGNGGDLPAAVGRTTHEQDIARGLDPVYPKVAELNAMAEVKGECIFDWKYSPKLHEFEKIGDEGDFDAYYDHAERGAFAFLSKGILAFEFEAPVDGKYTVAYYYSPANEPNRGFGFGIDDPASIKTYFGTLWLPTMSCPRVDIPVELKAGKHKFLITGPEGHDGVNIKGVDTEGFALYLVEKL